MIICRSGARCHFSPYLHIVAVLLRGATMHGYSLWDTPYENPSEQSDRQRKTTVRAINRKRDQIAKKERAKLALKPLCEHDKTHSIGGMVVQSYLNESRLSKNS